MKSLYDKDNRYTKEAAELDRKTLAATQGIMRLYITLGYLPREIGQIMEAAVREEMLLQLLEFKGK